MDISSPRYLSAVYRITLLKAKFNAKSKSAWYLSRQGRNFRWNFSFHSTCLASCDHVEHQPCLPGCGEIPSDKKVLSTKPQCHHRVVFGVRNLIFRKRRPSSRDLFA